MMAEIQGLSAGGAAAGFGVASLGGELNMGSSSLFAGPGALAGRGAVGYLGPGLHRGQSGIDGEVTGAGQGAGDGGSSTVGQKQGGAARERGVGAEWDAAVLGGGEDTEPLSPRNREYRRKMIEMDAEHKVWGLVRQSRCELDRRREGRLVDKNGNRCLEWLMLPAERNASFRRYGDTTQSRYCVTRVLCTGDRKR